MYTNVYDKTHCTSRRRLLLRVLRTSPPPLPPRPGRGRIEQPGRMRDRKKLRTQGSRRDHRHAHLGRPAPLPGGDLRQTRFRVVRSPLAPHTRCHTQLQPSRGILLHRRNVFRRRADRFPRSQDPATGHPRADRRACERGRVALEDPGQIGVQFRKTLRLRRGRGASRRRSPALRPPSGKNHRHRPAQRPPPGTLRHPHVRGFRPRRSPPNPPPADQTRRGFVVGTERRPCPAP